MRNARPVREKLQELPAVLRLFGEDLDAGHHAHGCGSVQPASLDGRCVRADASNRSNTAAVQARQVSSLWWK